MANPVMNQVGEQMRRTPAGYPEMPGYQVGGDARSANPRYPQSATPGVPGQSTSIPGQTTFDQGQQLGEQQRVSRPMTLDDVLVRTGASFGVMVLAAAALWFWGINDLTANAGTMLTISSVSALVAFALVLVSSFRRKPSAAITLGYSFFEGLFIGGISAFFEYSYPGIVVQALIGTVAVFVTCLVLFKSGLVRVNSKFMKILLLGMVSIIVYRLLAMVLAMVTPSSAVGNIDQITVMGLPLGLLVGLFAVIFGAMSLISDFDMVREGVRLGVDKDMSWSCALGIMVTVVWLYVEILRILAIVRDN
ncbi:MAG: Bax inhibitor-1/YccA family protein [Varibaculum cambriense]|uniref:Bax inhibitor-1/YccA family protein n=1 Tax=Varibaculum cambriense TaxID=184870 RepID=UPI00241D22CF|nr:Bax inhibitor-1/YccA family protein [Varibaculum cambriense]MBS6619865.1 Bax inhibitor-1/YccA family protein [Varibaculum cambriense]